MFDRFLSHYFDDFDSLQACLSVAKSAYEWSNDDVSITRQIDLESQVVEPAQCEL